MEQVKELWKPSPIFPDRYEISNYGNLRSLYGRHKPNIPPMPVKQYLNNSGYKIVRLKAEGSRKTATVHRLVLIAFIGLPQKNKECDHKDGDKTNNKIWNLHWVSRQENMAFLEQQGKRRKGERHGRAKLTDKEVEEIKMLKSHGITQTIIAKKFKVGDAQISRILSGTRRSKSDLEREEYGIN